LIQSKNPYYIGYICINLSANMKQLFVFLISILVIAGCNKSNKCEKEIYLLPEGFRGKLIVYFDQPDGQEILYEDSIRIYHIPPSGFLKTQFPKNGGCMSDDRINFFYEDSDGNRNLLDYFLNIDKDSIPTDRDYVLFTFLSNKDEKPEFVIHLVGHVSEFNELTQSIHSLDPIKILNSLD